MQEHTPQSEGSSVGKFFGKVRRAIVLTDEEIQRHKELSHKCTDIVQQKIDYLTNMYGTVASLQNEVSAFQADLIHEKIAYLKVKEREETNDLDEEVRAFKAYIDQFYENSNLKKMIDEHDAKPKAKILDISKRIEHKIHKAS
jgi:hypothetical protein